MRRIVLVLVLVTVSLNIPLAAQGTAPDTAATRVRIRQAGVREPTIGIITQFDADSIHLRAVEGDLAIARADISKLEISRGRRSNTDRGAKKGFLIGAAVGAVLGISVVADPDAYWYDGGAEIIPEAMAIIGLEGGLIGAGIGALSHSEHWQKSRTDSPTLSLYVAPRQGGAVMGLAMTF